MADKFTLAIDLGNDAMSEPKDIADALRKIAKSIEEEQKTGGKVRDVNGNAVGRWEFE